MKTIALFNNKGRVVKTSLVYHLAWMFSEMRYRIIAADLDPQANLSRMFLDKKRLEELKNGKDGRTIDQEIDPLFEGMGDIRQQPHIEAVDDRLGLLVGDLSLARREDDFVNEWTKCLEGDKRAFRVTTAFFRLISRAAESFAADIVLVDVGSDLGAITRSALIASDCVVLPLAPDMFSLQGLQNVGPTLKSWRKDWQQRIERKPPGLAIELPAGAMAPKGYIIMHKAVRFYRPVQDYDRWIAETPRAYKDYVLNGSGAGSSDDEITNQHCLAQLKYYHPLIPLVREARKPMFMLKPGDGAAGSQQSTVHDCYKHFKKLAERIISVCNVSAPE